MKLTLQQEEPQESLPYQCSHVPVLLRGTVMVLLTPNSHRIQASVLQVAANPTDNNKTSRAYNHERERGLPREHHFLYHRGPNGGKYLNAAGKLSELTGYSK